MEQLQQALLREDQNRMRPVQSLGVAEERKKARRFLLNKGYAKDTAECILKAIEQNPGVCASVGMLRTMGAVGLQSLAARAEEPTLDLLVVVVDEIVTLSQPSKAQAFHGRVLDLRNLSPRLTGAEIIAQLGCGDGVPETLQPGHEKPRYAPNRLTDYRYIVKPIYGAYDRVDCETASRLGLPAAARCLCWSERLPAGETNASPPNRRYWHGDHDIGVPGARIDVIEEPDAGISDEVAHRLHWTLAEAGIQTNDVLWCLPSTGCF